MRKEVLFAVIFGIILGAIILFGIRLANKSVSNLNLNKETATPSSEPAGTLTKKSFEIDSPQNHSVLTEKVITLTGRALPNSTLAVISEVDDLLIESSPEGTFSAQLNLVGGENTLTVTTLLKDNLTESQSITVIQTNTLPEWKTSHYFH